MDKQQMLERIEADAKIEGKFVVFEPRITKQGEHLVGFGRIRNIIGVSPTKGLAVFLDDGTVVYASFRYLRPLGDRPLGQSIRYTCDERSALVEPVEVLQ